MRSRTFTISAAVVAALLTCTSFAGGAQACGYWGGDGYGHANYSDGYGWGDGYSHHASGWYTYGGGW